MPKRCSKNHKPSLGFLGRPVGFHWAGARDAGKEDGVDPYKNPSNWWVSFKRTPDFNPTPSMLGIAFGGLSLSRSMSRNTKRSRPFVPRSLRHAQYWVVSISTFGSSTVELLSGMMFEDLRGCSSSFIISRRAQVRCTNVVKFFRDLRKKGQGIHDLANKWTWPVRCHKERSLSNTRADYQETHTTQKAKRILPKHISHPFLKVSLRAGLNKYLSILQQFSSAGPLFRQQT